MLLELSLATFNPSHVCVSVTLPVFVYVRPPLMYMFNAHLLCIRHFNELEHELSARLSRAYKPATYYMDIFVSPLATVIARNVAFICGSVLAVLLLLTVWDEDVLNVEHVSSVGYIGCDHLLAAGVDHHDGVWSLCGGSQGFHS